MGQYTRRGSCQTIADVIRRNTGMTVDELDVSANYNINCLKRTASGTYELYNLDTVANVLKDAAEKKIPITIVGDFDADGIDATAILAMTLNAIGLKPNVRLPKRMSEGFGLSVKIVDEIKEGILITVDNGIAAVEAIKKAKEKGLTVIITDHHLPNKDESLLDLEDSSTEIGVVDPEKAILPPADYIVNPHLAGTADFSDYCGAGIAYKLALRLTNDENLIKKLSGFATIGTVADVMPLIRDNRQIVKEGLKNLLDPNGRTTGMEALLRNTNKIGMLTSTDIGFTIGPMINAPGRMDDNGAMTSLSTIVFNGLYSKAEEQAKRLIEINTARKQAKEDGAAEAEVNIVMNCLYGDNPLCIYEPSVSEGIVGILAGKLAEDKKVPCFVFTDSDRPGIIKGSGRSYGNVHLKDMLDACSDLLTKYGGHKEAAGVSLPLANFEEMKSRMQAFVAELPAEQIDDNVYYDLEIDAKDVPAYLEEQKKYEPFGQGNPKPVFLVRNFEVLNKRLMGANSEHIKHNGKYGDALGFWKADAYKQIEEPKVINIIGTLSENLFNGVRTPQVEIHDMEPTKLEIAKTGRTMSLEKAIADRLLERRAI